MGCPLAALPLLLLGWCTLSSSQPAPGTTNATWTVATGHNPWAPRAARSSAAVLTTGTVSALYLIGGVNGSTATSDVWRSVDALTWTSIQDGGFPPRLGSCVLSVSPEIFVFGGLARDAFGVSHYLRDVWKASEVLSDSGLNLSWTNVSLAAPWAGRAGAVCFRFGRALWVMSGATPSVTADAWSSSDSGASWTLVSPPAPWAPRAYASVAELGGYVYLAGGTDFRTSFADLWKSANGQGWTRVAAPWAPRDSACLLSWPPPHSSGMAATLWMLGGRLGTGVGNGDTVDGTVESKAAAVGTIGSDGWGRGRAHGTAASAARLLLAGAQGSDGRKAPAPEDPAPDAATAAEATWRLAECGIRARAGALGLGVEGGDDGDAACGAVFAEGDPSPWGAMGDPSTWGATGDPSAGDVWRTGTDAGDWALVQGLAAWGPRADFGCVVFRGHIAVIGGQMVLPASAQAVGTQGLHSRSQWEHRSEVRSDAALVKSAPAAGAPLLRPERPPTQIFSARTRISALVNDVWLSTPNLLCSDNSSVCGGHGNCEGALDLSAPQLLLATQGPRLPQRGDRGAAVKGDCPHHRHAPSTPGRAEAGSDADPPSRPGSDAIKRLTAAAAAGVAAPPAPLSAPLPAPYGVPIAAAVPPFPLNCSCEEGWTNQRCSDTLCNAKTCIHGSCVPTNVTQNGQEYLIGVCVCSDPSQWNGTSCATPVCAAGCSPAHGSCSSPGACDCAGGWGGPRCSIQLNDLQRVGRWVTEHASSVFIGLTGVGVGVVGAYLAWSHSSGGGAWGGRISGEGQGLLEGGGGAGKMKQPLLQKGRQQGRAGGQKGGRQALPPSLSPQSPSPSYGAVGSGGGKGEGGSADSDAAGSTLGGSGEGQPSSPFSPSAPGFSSPGRLQMGRRGAANASYGTYGLAAGLQPVKAAKRVRFAGEEFST